MYTVSATTKYQPHPPQETVLYQVVRDNLDTFLAQTTAKGKCLPDFVIDEFEAFLDCKILDHGFVRLKCEDCGHEVLAAFSCKKRGFCPSCAGRRMAETEAHLIESVFPEAPVRQWVLTLPIAMRFWISRNRPLLNKAITIAVDCISSFIRKKAKQAGATRPQTGAVLFIQRAGSAINANPHLHILFLDGAYNIDADGNPNFVEIDPPTNDEIADVVQHIARRQIKLLRRAGFLQSNGDSENEPPLIGENEELSVHEECVGASIINRIALGPRAGLPVRTIRIGRGFGLADEKPEIVSPLCASVNGFSLHANVFVKGHQRWKLERLVRYVARPPLSLERMALTPAGEIKYELKTPWANNTTHVIFSPLELLEKLASIIPPPKGHLVRFFGVFGPNSKVRDLIVPKPKVDEQSPAGKDAIKRQRTLMAELLKRTFSIDLEECQICGGKMRRIAIVDNGIAARAILLALGIPLMPRSRPLPRPPPIMNKNELVYSYEPDS